jgi:hypothetical protein
MFWYSPCDYVKGGRSANKLRNRKSASLRAVIFIYFADLLQMWQFGDLRFTDHKLFAICDLRTKLYFAGLKLSQIRKICT